MLITRRSIVSGVTRTLDIPCTPEQLQRYINGEGHIQNIMPNLTDDQREFILTGISKEEWAEVFPPEEDE